jgi:gliding motility-associated-like protein
MKSINNIDELLKNSFDGFEATPPANVWSVIQQGISSTPTIHSQNSVSHTATVVKSASIITKAIIVAVSSGVVLGGSFIAYNYFNKTETAVTKNTIQQTQTAQIVEQKVNEKTPEQTQKIETIQPKINSSSQQNENIKADNNIPEKLTQPVVENGNKNEIVNPTTSPSNQNKTVVPPVQKAEQKQALPKPNHKEIIPENNTPSASNFEGNNFVKPFVADYLSPNGDGSNDFFDIVIDGETYYSLKVYDSQNHVLFESDNKEKKWDGTKMNLGEPCDQGDYYYSFDYKYKNAEKVYSLKGTVKLIRQKN